jgi:hypothetical protein
MLKRPSQKTKVIEIEAQKYPEIHTDSSFRIKNLGTRPHSVGGDKVLAEDGDIVFPTQSNGEKFFKTLNAISSGNKKYLMDFLKKLPSK